MNIPSSLSGRIFPNFPWPHEHAIDTQCWCQGEKKRNGKGGLYWTLIILGRRHADKDQWIWINDSVSIFSIFAKRIFLPFFNPSHCNITTPWDLSHICFNLHQPVVHISIPDGTHLRILTALFVDVTNPIDQANRLSRVPVNRQRIPIFKSYQWLPRSSIQKKTLKEDFDCQCDYGNDRTIICFRLPPSWCRLNI